MGEENIEGGRSITNILLHFYNSLHILYKVPVGVELRSRSKKEGDGEREIADPARARGSDKSDVL